MQFVHSQFAQESLQFAHWHVLWSHVGQVQFAHVQVAQTSLHSVH